MKTVKKVGIVLLVVVIANLAFILFIHHRNEVYRREWFLRFNQNMEETLKSNGPVKVGPHTWALPSANTTHPVTNKPISN
jgi:hypothetical protein